MTAGGGPTSFAGLLRHHRTRAGLSQQALADAAGLSRRGIADLERSARRSPYPDTARRLADALELDTDERSAFMAACRPVTGGSARRTYSLGAEPAPLIGRERELAELSRLLPTTRLLTMVGAAGIGKTRLALEIARLAQPDTAGGAVVVELASIDGDGSVPDALLAALGATVRPGESAADVLVRWLANRPPLILLDNCEHVVAGCARLCDMLLRAGPTLRLLATSREPLRIGGEVVWAVPPLDHAEAVALFLRRAGDAATAARPGAADLTTVDAICRRLEGIPLAIELAASWVAALGVDQVADLLSERLDLMSRSARLDPPRHRTLRAALDWSYALLDVDEQRLFARLAVFTGGWGLDGAARVGGSDQPNEHDRVAVLAGLSGLIEKSLVISESDGETRRFRYLETIRAYAVERLAASGEEDAIRERHADVVRAIAERGAASRLGIRYPGEMAALRREHPELRSALGWLAATGRREAGLALCLAVSGYWLAQGFLREGEGWLGIFLAEKEGLSPHALAAGLHARGRLVEYSGALDRAATLYERSADTSLAHEDQVVAARALCGSGDVAMHRAAYDRAHGLFEQALSCARNADSAPEVAQALLSLGRSAALLGDRCGPGAWLEEALAIERRLGDPWGVAYVLNTLGEQAARDGRLDEAQRLLEECHVLWRQAGTRMGERAVLMNLAVVQLRRGARVRAAELGAEALELGVELGDPDSAVMVRAVEIAAETALALGEPATARRLIAAADARRAELGAPRPTAEQPEIDRLRRASAAALADSAEADLAGRRSACYRSARLPDRAAARLSRAVVTLP